MSSLKQQVMRAVKEERFDDLEALVASTPRTLRALLGLTYRADDTLRTAAARGIAAAARYHPVKVQELVRRLIWAMNDESGTNALTAPEVLVAIAGERPELLLPMLPDIFRLSGDPGLREGLSETLRLVRDALPGEVGRRISDEINHPQQRQSRDLERLKSYARAKAMADNSGRR